MKKGTQRWIKFHPILFITLSLFTAFLLMGCRQSTNLDEPPEILYGQDVCDECSMIISEERFAASYVTTSGETHRFDDIGGMLLYDQKHQEDVRVYWVHDFDTKEWLKVKDAFFVLNDALATPMGWGLAAFATQEQADTYVTENGGVIADFVTLQQEIADGTLDATTLSTHQHEGEMEMDHDMDMGDE
jgi:copper chaperone NosL